MVNPSVRNSAAGREYFFLTLVQFPVPFLLRVLVPWPAPFPWATSKAFWPFVFFAPASPRNAALYFLQLPQGCRSQWHHSSSPPSPPPFPGILACLDGYMNIAMEQTEEYKAQAAQAARKYTQKVLQWFQMSRTHCDHMTTCFFKSPKNILLFVSHYFILAISFPRFLWGFIYFIVSDFLECNVAFWRTGIATKNLFAILPIRFLSAHCAAHIDVKGRRAFLTWNRLHGPSLLEWGSYQQVRRLLHSRQQWCVSHVQTKMLIICQILTAHIDVF